MDEMGVLVDLEYGGTWTVHDLHAMIIREMRWAHGYDDGMESVLLASFSSVKVERRDKGDRDV